MSTTITQIQMQTQQEEQLEYADPLAITRPMNTQEQVQASIRWTIERPPPRDLGYPNPRGLGGGGLHNLNNAVGQPQAPIIPVGDTKATGALPQIFNGSREKADNFIEEVKDYLQLNKQVLGFNSPRYKIVFTLTLIKGPKVAGWKRDMGRWLNNHVQPQNNTLTL